MRIAQISNGVVIDIRIADESAEDFVESDTANIGDTYANGVFTSPPIPVPSLEEKIKVMDDLIRARLNGQAISMGFDSIASAIVSAALPLGEYRQADGAALLLWSARTWQKAAEIRDAFLAGLRPEPTWAEVSEELPAYPIN